jgi:hypothetical protein
LLAHNEGSVEVNAARSPTSDSGERNRVAQISRRRETCLNGHISRQSSSTFCFTRYTVMPASRWWVSQPDSS